MSNNESGWYSKISRQRRSMVLAAGLLIGTTAGAATTATVVATTNSLEANSHKPAPQEAQIANSEFFRMAKLLVDGEFCDTDNDEVYGIINQQIEPEPNSVCESTPIDRNVTINNN